MHRLILWVIDEQHRHEQQVSEASVKLHMPDVETKCIVLPKKELWYEGFIQTLRESLAWNYDMYLSLDSDTFVTEPIYDLFEVLEKYDVVSTHAPARQTTDMPFDVYVPDAYCEMNTGCFGYRNTSQVWQLFDSWLQQYYANQSTSGDNDQAALRVAMWKQGTHAWVMPEEYNCRVGFGAFIAGRVKILHLRSKDIAKAAEQINAEGGMRTITRGTVQ